MEKTDITIIGAGVIGLSISYMLSSLGKELVVVEKNPSFGQETSSRNSEVIHSGIYYPKDSFKSKTCIRGKTLLYKLCRERGIPHKKTGKLIVANDTEGEIMLGDIYRNALECGVDTLQFLDKNGLKRKEPQIEAEKGIFSPDTGIIDSHAFMKMLFMSARDNGANFSFSVEAAAIKRINGGYVVTIKEPNDEMFSFQTKIIVNAAGLNADKIANLVGINPETSGYKIHYCKGQYFRIRDPRKFSIKHLVYPPPTSTDLGIHITPDMAAGLRLGPDAKYVEEIDYTIDSNAKSVFFESVSKFLPSLKMDDLMPDTAGVRPKLQASNENFRDFVIKNESERGFPGFINLIGIESPGLTSSLAIAELIKDIVSKFT